jgi:hypothetical protein
MTAPVGVGRVRPLGYRAPGGRDGRGLAGSSEPVDGPLYPEEGSLISPAIKGKLTHDQGLCAAGQAVWELA